MILATGKSFERPRVKKVALGLPGSQEQRVQGAQPGNVESRGNRASTETVAARAEMVSTDETGATECQALKGNKESQAAKAPRDRAELGSH